MLPLTVHPRLRGELFSVASAGDTAGGSSPLARGTPANGRLNSSGTRFIPACAGNSNKKRLRRPCLSVHPRLRGELIVHLLAEHLYAGSSPLTRGTHVEADRGRKRRRFIPAYAGNSERRVCGAPGSTVHPRLRGELRTQSLRSSWIAGSSPLTRGTQHLGNRLCSDCRFIPAYAGNSLKQGIEHLTNSSKDFLSGKYAKNPETVLNHFKNSSLD